MILKYEKIDNRKYILSTVRNDCINNPEFADLTYEDVLDLKELIHILNFNNNDIYNDLISFLSLKNNYSGNVF